MDAPSTAVAMSSTSVVPTAAKPVPRTKLSASLWFGTSLKLLPSGISPRPQSTRFMSFLSSTRSCTTVCRALFTPKWSETDPEKPERTGHLLPDILWRLPWTTTKRGPMLQVAQTCNNHHDPQTTSFLHLTCPPHYLNHARVARLLHARHTCSACFVPSRWQHCARWVWLTGMISTVISENRFTRFLSIALACCASLPFWLSGGICVERHTPCKSFFGNDCTCTLSGTTHKNMMKSYSTGCPGNSVF